MDNIAEKIQRALDRLAELLGIPQQVPQLQRVPVRVRADRR
ncbi:hypothetical protein [Gloeobacter kilaueensis]|uniref:Uncharacterized protein n=1 Tax=Gloeobacter kilaueensis (strain ATCC BAA-2537 / CCAP 1431/1 / ULC 316 / JS1) TaxID=1183438 RepID=U5QL14_GLOK1|nr:hypothetical protein [Gloeobacter kilaueensis]AGY59573.1 hypothetical protein GKIL_3327 [Gloeobacter kilaueensis JS1]